MVNHQYTPGQALLSFLCLYFCASLGSQGPVPPWDNKVQSQKLGMSPHDHKLQSPSDN